MCVVVVSEVSVTSVVFPKKKKKGKLIHSFVFVLFTKITLHFDIIRLLLHIFSLSSEKERIELSQERVRRKKEQREKERTRLISTVS